VGFVPRKKKGLYRLTKEVEREEWKKYPHPSSRLLNLEAEKKILM